jgi:hypothetical protein
MATIPINELIRMTTGDNTTWSATITPSTAISSVWFTAKQSYSQADSAAAIAVEPSDVTIANGALATSITFPIAAVETGTTTALTAGDYVYDVQFLIGGQIQTWFSGDLILLPETTKRRT